MTLDWRLRESGPVDAEHTVLLLPGGMCSAGSYAEVMAQPVLAGVRMVAATLPGYAGAPPPEDCAIEAYARDAADLAVKVDADVLVGFSMGGTVALEMAASGGFIGPVVLLGTSLSAADEPVFFRAVVRSGDALGALPASLFVKMSTSMVRRLPVSVERRAELRGDMAANDPRVLRRILRGYLRWLQRDDEPAARLCQAGLPVWVVHAEKGDGGLTDAERHTLRQCPRVQLVTLPGSVFFLPVEAPDRVADVIAEAVGAARRGLPGAARRWDDPGV